MHITLNIGPAFVKENKDKWVLREVPYNMSNKTLHYMVKYKWAKEWKQAVGDAVMERRRSLGKLPLTMPTITVILGHTQWFDKDGSYTAAKPLLDGLKEAGVIIDDSPKHIQYFVVQTKKFKGVKILIETK